MAGSRRSKRIVYGLLVSVLVLTLAPFARASAYDASPKLVVLLVIDQFRGDYLDRYRADFKGRGFRLFLDHGAYFEDCYYDYANTETAPGHATLATGAYTDGHGISSNAWWNLDRNKERPVTSVEDERYHLVGLPNANHGTNQGGAGASPLNLRASTIGDSLRLATQGDSKLFGISLKDRAAILATGYSANAAYWIDPASGLFITSSYYMPSLPDWVSTFDTSGRIAQAQQEADVSENSNFYETVGPTPAANSYELDFARALISAEDLGKHPATDMLVISLSANDLLGHRVGPDSPDEREMVDSLDQQLDSFFTWLEKNIPGGLAHVWIALSADHGIAPVPAQASGLGLPSATFDLDRFIASLNDSMNAKFSPGEKVEYVLPHQSLPYLSLDRPNFEVAGINEQEAEQAIQEAVPAAVASLTQGSPTQEQAPNPPDGAASASPSPANAGSSPEPSNAGPVGQAPSIAPAPPVRVPPIPIVVHTYTREQLASGQLPPSEWGLLLAHSYSPNGGWYVMVVPAAYQIPAVKRGTTHFTPWSYDRHVPLGFYGAPFIPGIYHGRVQPVDLAATLASLLGVNQPSASIGTVLTQAIRKVPAAPRYGAQERRRQPSATNQKQDPNQP